MKKVAAAFFALLVINSLALQRNQDFDLESSISRGRELYSTNCVPCHLENGEGIEGVYPPLAKSDYMMKNKTRSIQQILYGVNGPIKVNGKKYDGVMPGYDLSDKEVSDLNYVRNSFSNKGGAILPAEVKMARK